MRILPAVPPHPVLSGFFSFNFFDLSFLRSNSFPNPPQIRSRPHQGALPATRPKAELHYWSSLQRRDARAADLAAIEKLHKADIAATLTQDPSSLTNLFSDDAVNLVFPAPVVGIKAMKEAFEKFRADYPDFQVLKYAPDTKDVQIVDGWAIEVISGESTYKTSAKDDPVTVAGKSMRVLKRQSDGSWKFALVGLK